MADDLTVSREGDMLVIRILIKKATPSASGKTLVVASTRGNQKTGVQIDGKDLYLGVNAYIYAEPKGAKSEWPPESRPRSHATLPCGERAAEVRQRHTDCGSDGHEEGKRDACPSRLRQPEAANKRQRHREHRNGDRAE